MALMVVDPTEDFNVKLKPAELRAIADQLAEHAKKLSDSGDLLNHSARFD
jgi:hypothetical protein